MVLRSMPPPAWLESDAPDGDVVISSRFRLARNLVGFRFPHRASGQELKEVETRVKAACRTSPIKLEPMGKLTEAERDYLLGSRLISPEFAHREPGRSLILDRDRCVSLMVNEEDHLRLQTVTAGWALPSAEQTGLIVYEHLESALEFMQTEELGFLSASPTNLGFGQRRSALFHLIGLAQTNRLTRMLKSLAYLKITTRGLYGETSRAVGAFVQISATSGTQAEFRGACNQVIQEERQARQDVDLGELSAKARQAAEFAVSSNEISLRDALLVLGWVRWATMVEIDGFKAPPRTVDSWTATMEVYGTQEEKVAARHRAEFLRTRLEPLLRSNS